MYLFCIYGFVFPDSGFRRFLKIKKRHVKILQFDQRLYNICMNGISH